MTAYEIVDTIISVASIMVGTSMMIISLLSFLDKRNRKK